MAATLIMKRLVSFLIISLLMAATTAPMLLARELPVPKHGKNLVARLNGEDGGIVNCWEALLELRSCTNEIIIFFLDGEMYLGLECCKAIRIITQHCWPSMLASLGFTAEEGDILRGYCDGSAIPSPAPATSPSPAPAPATSPSPAQAPRSLIPVV